MTDKIAYSRHDDIVVLRIENPPVNALGNDVRAGIFAGMERFDADASAHVAVIHCAGRTFHAGADITEFGKPPQGPSLPEALDKLEAFVSDRGAHDIKRYLVVEPPIAD